MLMAATDKPSQKLNLIDAIQRLGVSYHFEIEIEDVLEKNYHDCNDDNDLCTVAIQFRLLRQQGYNVSCDIFNMFKDDKGNFKECLICDVLGMLSLYEAACLSMHGEDILDEALAFTTIHLESMVPHLSSPLAQQVIHALKWPIRKGLPRLEARHYFSIYQEDISHNRTLVKFAKLDFNILQALHLNDLSGIAKWWKDLDFATMLPYARDRVVECYFWVLGVFFESQYPLARRILTKLLALQTIIDDTYDVYGTLEELKLFTEAIERWEISAVDLLPEYMKVSYRALMDFYSEIEEETTKEGRSYCVPHAKEAMKKLVRAYFVEAKWCHDGYVPTVEEYMSIAQVTLGCSLFVTTSFICMGEIVSKEAFDWVSHDPKILRALSIICRIADDMSTHKFEQKRGHVASAVECCMKQHGISEQQAQDLLQKQVTNAWKDINQECLKPTTVPMPLLLCVLNIARVTEVIYKDGDGFTQADILKHYITPLLIDPVLI